jgi:hypothetical protein
VLGGFGNKADTANPGRTLPSKLGHNIWTNDPSQRLHPTPINQVSWRLTRHLNMPTHWDTRTQWLFFYHHRCQDFCSPAVSPWHWKPNGAPSFGLVPRTLPLRGPWWCPLGVAWLVSFSIEFFFSLGMLQTTNNGCATAYSILALYHGSDETGRLVLLHSIP